MAVSATGPIAWGAVTGRIPEAVWMSLAAEGICFVELKGSFNQGVRVMAAGVLLTMLFTIFGSITGNGLWLSVAGMLVVGFISGLFKNLGDRGSSLSISAFVVFIICNAYPTHGTAELKERILLVLAGGVWTVFVGMLITAWMPAQEPYRRTVGLIWKTIADLAFVVSRGWDGKNLRSGIRDIYKKEKEVRASIDNSLHFYETTAHQAKTSSQEYQLAQVRKATSLVAAHINAISEELETISIRETGNVLQQQLYNVLKGIQQTCERMAVFIITLKTEDELLLSNRISRLQQYISVLKQYDEYDSDKIKNSIGRVVQLTERTVKLIESCIAKLEEMGEDRRVFRSYSLFKTLFILHPGYWYRNMQLLFNFNTFTTRYAIRTAIGAGIAMLISKWFNIDHGYWIPFTVIIVSQPYFGATLKKAFDRVIGTVLGGIAGGLFLRLHTGLWIEIATLFICSVLMIYYLRRRYSVGAFFITISLIVLFNIELPVVPGLIYTRAFSTIGGSVIAVIAGFALLPHKDKKLLPVYLAKAICHNYEYFIHTFFFNDTINWTKYKRNAESNNSNVFDSFSRYILEPGGRKKHYSIYYQVITHNVRITRELNNINIERENNTETDDGTDMPDQRLEICLYWFRQNMQFVKQMEPGNTADLDREFTGETAIPITRQQQVYLDRLISELKSMHQDLEKLKTREHEAGHMS